MNVTVVQLGTQIATDVLDSSGIEPFGIGAPQTLGDLVATWRETHPKAESMLRTTCVRLSDYFQAPIGEIRLDSIEESRNGFRPFLVARGFSEHSVRTYVNHLQVLLKSAESAGWRHTEHIPEAWHRIMMFIQGRRIAGLVRDLAAVRKTPQDVVTADVDQWVRDQVQKGLSYGHAVRIGTRFWRDLQSCGYQNKPPLCVLREKRYGIPLQRFPIKLREEVTELLRWKQVPYAWDRPPEAHIRPSTAQILLAAISQLYGFAVNIRHETDIISLSQLVQRHIVGSFVEWSVTVRQVKGQGIVSSLRLISAAMRQHPIYEGVDLGWFKPLLEGIPCDSDSVRNKRKAERCVEYSVIQDILAKIHATRVRARKRGRKQFALVVRNELIIRWLSVLIWRQRNIRECRIGGPIPNLYKGPVPAITTIDMPDWARAERERNPDVALWQFHFAEDETKTGCTVDCLLPRQLIEPLEEYLADFRSDLLSGNDPHTLFLNAAGAPMSISQVTSVVGRNTLKHCGRRVTPHTFRDILCRAWLKAHPKDYLTVSKLLWHTGPDQVIATYGSLFNESSGVCAVESWLSESEDKTK